MLTDRLVAQTGLGTALLGMVELNVQIYCWMQGTRALVRSGALAGGLQKQLCDSAAGWLLLSTIPAERREGVLRRLRAEAPADRKFNVATLNQRIQTCGRDGYVVGPAGFNPTADICAVLLPSEADERPMVLGFIYEPCEDIDASALVALLHKSVQGCIAQPNNSVALPNAHQSAAKPVSSAA
jgi:hypothetical protein